MAKIYILGTETSCDETSAAVVVNGRQVKSSVVSSQIEFHKKYGGVVPEIASRKHVELINSVFQEALLQAGLKWKDLDAVAVTKGPGLIGALIVGEAAAKAVALSIGKPLIGVNHLEGHIYSVFLDNVDLKGPFLCLIVSGGHTSLVIVEKEGRYKEIGHTLDDAAGEAYDKVAKLLKLGYPGGPVIESTALKGNRKAVKFPRALMEEGNYNFSFSGLKTAVVYYLKDKPDSNVRDISASFEEAVVSVLTEKTIRAAEEYGLNTITVAGGVSANDYLKKILRKAADQKGFKFYFPSKRYATDNAAMIAAAAYKKFVYKEFSSLSEESLANLSLG